MRNRYIYIGAFVLFVIYTLFFTIKTGEEYILLPKKVLEAPFQTTRFSGRTDTTPAVGIELADYAGFIGVSLEADNSLSTRFYPKKGRVSKSSTALVFYNDKDFGKEIILSSDLSKKKCKSTGWPLQLSDRFFFYDAAGSSIEERGLTGGLLWERDLNSFLTAISATEELLLLGTVDGTCFILDRAGAEVFRYKPDYGGFAVIVGGVISSDGQTLAIVSGTDPQKLEVFRLSEDLADRQNKPELIYLEELAISQGRPVKMFFDEGEGSLKLLLEGLGGVREICLDTSDLCTLSYFGDLAQLLIDPLTGNKTVLTGISEKGNVSVYTAKERLLYQEFFDSNFRSVGEVENYSFFSLDNTLLIVEKIYE